MGVKPLRQHKHSELKDKYMIFDHTRFNKICIYKWNVFS